MMPHQDYAKWLPSDGETVYTTNPDWDELNEEWALVDTVENHRTYCIECETRNSVYKKTCDTPSFLCSPEGICIKCLRKCYGPKLITQETMENSK